MKRTAIIDAIESRWRASIDQLLRGLWRRVGTLDALSKALTLDALWARQFLEELQLVDDRPPLTVESDGTFFIRQGAARWHACLRELIWFSRLEHYPVESNPEHSLGDIVLRLNPERIAQAVPGWGWSRDRIIATLAQFAREVPSEAIEVLDNALAMCHRVRLKEHPAGNAIIVQVVDPAIDAQHIYSIIAHRLENRVQEEHGCIVIALPEHRPHQTHLISMIKRLLRHHNLEPDDQTSHWTRVDRWSLGRLIQEAMLFQFIHGTLDELKIRRTIPTLADQMWSGHGIVRWSIAPTEKLSMPQRVALLRSIVDGSIALPSTLDPYRPASVQVLKPKHPRGMCWQFTIIKDHPEALEALETYETFSQPLPTVGITTIAMELNERTLWNYTALRHSQGRDVDAIAQGVIRAINQWSASPLHESQESELRRIIRRYDAVELRPLGDPKEASGAVEVLVRDESVWKEIETHHNTTFRRMVTVDNERKTLPHLLRGPFSYGLIHELAIPVKDRAGGSPPATLDIAWRKVTPSGVPVVLGDHQTKAIAAVVDATDDDPHSVVVMPPGTGKTLVGIGAIVRSRQPAIILCTSVAAIRQWHESFLKFTTIDPKDIGEFHAGSKKIRPITLTTYSMMAALAKRLLATGAGITASRQLAAHGRFGWLIADETQTIPAKTFRWCGQLHVGQKLGLTATLVREDGLENLVYALVGRPRFEYSWAQAQRDGRIPPLHLTLVVVPLVSLRRKYEERSSQGNRWEAHVISWENPRKIDVVKAIRAHHGTEPMIVFGQLIYTEFLEHVAQELHAPFVDSDTPTNERLDVYNALREGRITTKVTSPVGDRAIDIPCASVAVQLSGLFGSREQFAQRVGRLLRPAPGKVAHAYDLISDTPDDLRQARKRLSWLKGHGYEVREVTSKELLEEFNRS